MISISRDHAAHRAATEVPRNSGQPPTGGRRGEIAAVLAEQGPMIDEDLVSRLHGRGGDLAQTSIETGEDASTKTTPG